MLAPAAPALLFEKPLRSKLPPGSAGDRSGDADYLIAAQQFEKFGVALKVLMSLRVDKFSHSFPRFKLLV
jgi:hypothetical protein